MLQVNLNGPASLYPSQMPTMGSRAPNTWPKPPTAALPPSALVMSSSRGQTGAACGYGFTFNNGVCMSDGCITGRSPCVVMDMYKRTCSYDQMLAFANKYGGAKLCGPAPTLPPPPQTPEVPAVPVDVSPNPGTQAVATVPVDQLPNAQHAIPRWVLVVGGLSVVAIVVALLARR